jgi:hypothetical protein
MSFIFSYHWNGRFGNRMHQYAYGMTYAKKHNVDFILPSYWEGTKLFKNNNKILSENIKKELCIAEKDKDRNESRKNVIKKHFPKVEFIDPQNEFENYEFSKNPVCFDDVCAYDQSIFSEMSKRYLLKIFEFSDEVKNTEAYKYWESKAGTYDIAHLRRDDIANPEYNKTHEQGYSVISKVSYANAILENGFNLSKFEWTSDDYTKRWHTNRLDNELFGWKYPEGSEYRPGKIFDWLEDFLRLYFARTIFRANSSFSWWAAFLSPTATVYSPVLDKQIIYGRDDFMEINVKFVKGNHPHWMYDVDDIIIDD